MDYWFLLFFFFFSSFRGLESSFHGPSPLSEDGSTSRAKLRTCVRMILVEVDVCLRSLFHFCYCVLWFCSISAHFMLQGHEKCLVGFSAYCLITVNCSLRIQQKKKMVSKFPRSWAWLMHTNACKTQPCFLLLFLWCVCSFQEVVRNGGAASPGRKHTLSRKAK